MNYATAVLLQNLEVIDIIVCKEAHLLFRKFDDSLISSPRPPENKNSVKTSMSENENENVSGWLKFVHMDFKTFVVWAGTFKTGHFVII